MNAHEHLQDDVLIDGLYGLCNVEARLNGCAVCASRWNEMREKHAALAVPATVPADVLAAQRRNIYARIEHPSRMPWAAPAVAAACLLAIGVFMHHSAAPVRPAPASASVAPQLPEAPLDVYSDVYSMEQSFEPRASASFRVLFEADGAPESGGSSTKQ